MKSSGGFTWYEVLILLVLLAVLCVLLFPAVESGPRISPRSLAKNDVVQIATAIAGFQTEYGRFPSTNGEVQDVGGPLLENLMGAKTDLNPRQIVFLEVQNAKKGKSGLSNGNFLDPWGSPYKVKLDTDGDGKITNSGPAQQPTAVVNKIVAVWTDPSTHSDSASVAKKQKRFVTSWE